MSTDFEINTNRNIEKLAEGLTRCLNEVSALKARVVDQDRTIATQAATIEELRRDVTTSSVTSRGSGPTAGVG